MDRRSVEFADIREKPSPRGPSLDQGTSAELDRSDRASAPILQIIVPPQTSPRRPAWFPSCL